MILEALKQLLISWYKTLKAVCCFKETVRRAVAEVRQERVRQVARSGIAHAREEEEGERGKRPREEEAQKRAAKKPNLDLECRLETQKYLRDVRTQHAQLKKSIGSLR